MKQSMSQLWLTGVMLLLSSSIAQAEISTMEARSVTTTQWFELEAIVEAVKEATISAQTTGRVASIAFDVNDFVNEGQVIIQLVDKEQRAALRQAQAQVSQNQALSADAQQALKRAQSLHAQGSVSVGELDQASARAKSMQAALKAARALRDRAKEQLSYTQIRAPYSGIVKTRHIEVGETVNPGVPVMTGLSLQELRVVADIPQRFASQIKHHKNIKVKTPTQTLDALHVVVFPYADPKSHTFKIRANINTQNASLFPGMWVKLQIPTGTREILTVPSSAVFQRGEFSAVFIITPKGPALRQVRLGRAVGSSWEILSGLRQSDVLAVSANDAINELEHP